MSFEKLFSKLNDLPVAATAGKVTASVLQGVVTILSSATGSGKTLYQTAHLAENTTDRVVVLVPRRFLAVNAAEIVAELSGHEIGTVVGYAVGSQTGDRSRWSTETKLLFATNGFALASGLVRTATTFVLDEVHETSMDLSIIRALLHRRMSQGESIRVLEMSATMDTTHQSKYWSGVAQTNIVRIDGKTYPCEHRYRPASRVADEVFELIREGRKGILVFRPGVGEVEETVEEITRLVTANSLEVEISKIYGEMNYEERHAAVATPAPGKVKVLVGTNVVESGANIPWLDAGVTCGTGKENHVREETGATYLKLIELPRWRIQQQTGRVNRFRPGIFVLCSQISFEQRDQATRPEIERLALTELVMHCSGFGLRTHELTFDYAPIASKVLEAETKLQRLGLIDEDCALTDAGAFIQNLPVGPETGAMLWHARTTGCLEAMVPLAATIEVGGLRKDFKRGHGLNRDSDHFDSILALRDAFRSRGRARKEVMEELNVGYKRFEAAVDLMNDLERRLNVVANFDIEDHLTLLRRSILAGSLDKLFRSVGYRGEVASVKNRLAVYRIGQGSAVYYVETHSFAGGDLRVITPRDQYKSPFTILEKVTVFDFEDLKSVAQTRPNVLVEEIQTGRIMGGEGSILTHKLFGEYVVLEEYVPMNTRSGFARASN